MRKSIQTILSLSLAAVGLLWAGCSMHQGHVAADIAAGTPESDLARLQGSWSGQAVNNQSPHECSFVVSGNHFEFHDRTETNVWYKGTFKLREDTDPHQFVAEVTDCPFPQYEGKTSIAIYQLANGVLTLTGNEPGKTVAPNSFDDPEAARIDVRKQ